MDEILNVTGIHNNGKAELHVGIRQNKFAIKRDSETKKVSIYDPSTNEQLVIDGVNSNAINCEVKSETAAACGEQSKALADASFAYGTEVTAAAINTVAFGGKTIAGSKGYKLIYDAAGNLGFINNNDGTGKCTLATIEGLEVSMRYSLRVSGMICNTGKIVSIDGLTVIIDGVPNDISWEPDDKIDPNNYTVENYLTIVGRPDLGDTEVGFNAMAIGENNIAQDRDAAAFGRNVKVVGQYGFGEGRDNIVGYASHAEGRGNEATGDMSHAEGHENKAIGKISHVEGRGNKSIGTNSHAEGYSTTAEGDNSHAEGGKTIAKGSCSHSENSGTQANGENSHAEGEATIASGKNSHTEGYKTQANSEAAHAENSKTQANGENSHAEGYDTRANGNISHAEGYNTLAIGDISHTEGQGTIANGTHQHVQGKYNIADTTSAFIIGNGTSSKPSNAMSVDWDGNVKIAGTLTDMDGNSILGVDANYVDSKIAEMVDSAPETLDTLNELAKALGDDPNFAATVATELGNKVDKIEGKGLSTNDLTDELLEKLENAGEKGIIEKGEGINSVQQPVDTIDWSSGNATAKRYIAEGIGTADDGYTIAVDESGKVLVGAYGKNSTMMNGKSQTVGGKTHAEGSKTIAFENNSHAEGNDTFAGGKHSHAEGSKTATTGNAAHAEGIETEAFGDGSHTEGYRTKVTGEYGHAEGSNTTADENAHAEGNGTTAYWNSHAEGINTVAKGSGAHAEGYETIAEGINSHTEGRETYTKGDSAHAEGGNTVAEGDYSHTEGYNTVTVGQYSHAEGTNTQVKGHGAHVEGGAPVTLETRNKSKEAIITEWTAASEDSKGQVAEADFSHAEGHGNLVTGFSGHVEGQYNHTEGASAHAEGQYTHAKGALTHTEGYKTIAKGKQSHAGGKSSKAIGESSFVHGDGCSAGAKGYYWSGINFETKSVYLTDTQTFTPQPVSNDALLNLSFESGYSIGDIMSIENGSHYDVFGAIIGIEGNKLVFESLPFDTIAGEGNTDYDGFSIYCPEKPEVGTIFLKNNAISFGESCKASGRSSAAIGVGNRTQGNYAFAEGRQTTAVYGAHSEGYKSKALGQNSHTEGANTKTLGNQAHAEGQNTIAEGQDSHAEGNGSKALKTASHAEGINTKANGNYSHTEGHSTETNASYSHAEGYLTKTGAQGAHAEGRQTEANGQYSHSEGYLTIASSSNAHSEGNATTASGENAHAEGWQTRATGKASHAEGYLDDAHKDSYGATALYSHSEGFNTLAGGNYSHAEGRLTQAKAQSSHAEGQNTQATAQSSHSEGENTVASGKASHAEGIGTSAKNNYSHTEGEATISSCDHQHVQGRYNLEDANQAFIIGNGSSSKRSNALTLDWNGNLKIAGTFTDGDGNSFASMMKRLSDLEKAYEEKLGQIEEALEAILSIQEQIIPQYMTFKAGDKTYTCLKGMTWEELENYDNGSIWKELALENYLNEAWVIIRDGSGQYTFQIETIQYNSDGNIIKGRPLITDQILSSEEGHYSCEFWNM